MKQEKPFTNQKERHLERLFWRSLTMPYWSEDYRFDFLRCFASVVWSDILNQPESVSSVLCYLPPNETYSKNIIVFGYEAENPELRKIDFQLQITHKLSVSFTFFVDPKLGTEECDITAFVDYVNEEFYDPENDSLRKMVFHTFFMLFGEHDSCPAHIREDDLYKHVRDDVANLQEDIDTSRIRINQFYMDKLDFLRSDDRYRNLLIYERLMAENEALWRFKIEYLGYLDYFLNGQAPFYFFMYDPFLNAYSYRGETLKGEGRVENVSANVLNKLISPKETTPLISQMREAAGHSENSTFLLSSFFFENQKITVGNQALYSSRFPMARSASMPKSCSRNSRPEMHFEKDFLRSIREGSFDHFYRPVFFCGQYRLGVLVPVLNQKAGRKLSSTMDPILGFLGKELELAYHELFIDALMENTDNNNLDEEPLKVILQYLPLLFNVELCGSIPYCKGTCGRSGHLHECAIFGFKKAKGYWTYIGEGCVKKRKGRECPWQKMLETIHIPIEDEGSKKEEMYFSSLTRTEIDAFCNDFFTAKEEIEWVEWSGDKEEGKNKSLLAFRFSLEDGKAYLIWLILDISIATYRAHSNDFKLQFRRLSGLCHTVHALVELGKRQGLHDYIHTFKNELDQRLLWRLDLEKWENPDCLSESDRGKLDVVRESLQRTYYIVKSFYVKDRRQRGRLLEEESILLPAGELCERFNSQLETLKNHFVTKRELNHVPHAQLQANGQGKYWTLLPVFDCICFEVILNVADHAIFEGQPPTITLCCDEEIASLVVNDTVNEAGLELFEAALSARGTTRISGNRAIELYEELLDLPLWSGEILNNDGKRIRIVYPMAKIME